MAIKTFNKNLKETILESVDELVDFVKPTYGPASNKVLLSRPYASDIIDDGVAIARAYKSEDPIRDAIISVIKEVAIKTNDKVGDGTTSSLIMLQAVVREMYKSGKSPREIVEELKTGVEEAKVQLLKKAKKISSKEELNKIANISFNNSAIGSIISDLVYKLGSDAVITIEESNTTETTSDTVDGIEIKSGFISPYMINTEKMECELKNPLILVSDYRFVSGTDMLSIMEVALKEGHKNMVLIAEHVEGDALATLIVNKQKGVMNTLAIEIPHGDKVEFVQDICLITGATPITHDKNFDFAKLSAKDFGKCEKVISKNDKTTIIGSKGNKSEIKNAVNTLRSLISTAKTTYEKEKLEKRLAKFTQGIAVIKLGAPTEGELKALKMKVEDAINAVKSAYRNGIVCGAGLSLARIKTSSSILNKALKYPFKQLKENSSIECDLDELKENEAINAITGKKGDYMQLGIIDPVEVLCAGVESAVSIASLLITTKGIIYEVPDEK